MALQMRRAEVMVPVSSPLYFKHSWFKYVVLILSLSHDSGRTQELGRFPFRDLPGGSWVTPPPSKPLLLSQRSTTGKFDPA